MTDCVPVILSKTQAAQDGLTFQIVMYSEYYVINKQHGNVKENSLSWEGKLVLP